MEGETRQNIDSFVAKLRQVELRDESNGDGDADIIQILDTFGSVSKISIEEISEYMIHEVFLTLLNHPSKTIASKTAKAIAKIAKTERGSEKCTDGKLTKSLMELLKEDDIEVLTQATRALGNICYENEKARKMVEGYDGLSEILTVLKKGIGLSKTEGASLLRCSTAGFLLNFLDDQIALQQKALEENVVPIICRVLELDSTHEDEKAAIQALLTLRLINDSDNKFLDERLCIILVKKLTKLGLSQCSEMCLKLVFGYTDNENGKLLFAKAGLCELLLQLVHENCGPCCTNEETRSNLRIACNLIVLILTGDESANLLYDGSNGPVYKKLVEWLDSTDTDLQVTAICAMGNFANIDAHCQLMVEQKIHCKLLQLLRDEASQTGGMRIQYAPLTDLRNLVISPTNKSILLADGLIDTIYPMLGIPMFPVIFKSLAILRIVIQGQREAAISLGKRDDLVEKVVKWRDTDDSLRVQGEANRLTACLIIHSRDKDVVSTIIKYGGIEHLVKMVMAKHALTQNEAVMSLTILSAISLADAEQSLIEAQVDQALLKFFDQRNPEPDPAVMSSALILTYNLLKSKSEILIEHLKKSKLLDVYENLSEAIGVSAVSSKAYSI